MLGSSRARSSVAGCHRWMDGCLLPRLNPNAPVVIVDVLPMRPTFLIIIALFSAVLFLQLLPCEHIRRRGRR